MVEFVKYPKTMRLNKLHVVVTEKIDGTNGFLGIPEDTYEPITVGSRNRIITPGKTTDNYGFAAWVAENEEALRRLGPGEHYGEWWGQGIARHYGMDRKHFSLFNALRPLPEGLPDNVHTVPILTQFHFNLDHDQHELLCAARDMLIKGGSVAAPGFMNPEGIIVAIAHVPYKVVFDKTGPSPEQTNDE